MRSTIALLLASALLVPGPIGPGTATAQDDPLPSWTQSPARSALLDFVARVTREGGPEYVRPEERVAVFDNDGTLWCEKPVYVQFQFAIDRLKVLAPTHPEWMDRPTFRAALADDISGVLAGGYEGLIELMSATHAGMTTDEFAAIVLDWLETARHPRFHRPYNTLVYRPMLEVLSYLRSRGFKTFLVSGGGVEFMRAFVERDYGIPPEQVVGTSIVTKFELREGVPVLVREPEIFFIDDKAGKPVGINLHIGRRPIVAFGNSDGDLEMLQWTTGGPGPRLGLIVHHTDAEREYAYDRDSIVGRLDKALDQAPERGWVVVDMKRDWKTIYPPEVSGSLRLRPRGAGAAPADRAR